MRRLAVLLFGAVLFVGAVLFMFGSSLPLAAAADRPSVQQTPAVVEPTEQPVAGNPGVSGTPTYTSPTFSDGSGSGTPSRFGPPPTLADLLTQFPDLKTYLDKIKGLTADKLDLGELYVNIITLYKAKGAAAVGIFLRDSGLLDELHIPQGYLDLLTVYDQSGMDGLLAAAQKRKIINSHNELSGFMKLDSNDNLAVVTTALQTLGLSTYAFSAAASELEIGIPVDMLMQFQSPSTLLTYLLKVANTPHVIGFRVPTPLLEPPKAP